MNSALELIFSQDFLSGQVNTGLLVKPVRVELLFYFVFAAGNQKQHNG